MFYCIKVVPVQVSRGIMTGFTLCLNWTVEVSSWIMNVKVKGRSIFFRPSSYLKTFLWHITCEKWPLCEQQWSKSACTSAQSAGSSLFFDIFYTGAGPGFLRGVDLIILPYLLYVFGKTGLSKQCRSDAAERGVWSGSALFTTHPAILHTFTGSKMDLLKRSMMKSVPLIKISHENENGVQ